MDFFDGLAKSMDGIDSIAQKTFDSVMDLIDGGMSPDKAVKEVQSWFSGEFVNHLQREFSRLLSVEINKGDILDGKAISLPLSSRLYELTNQTSLEVQALVDSHAKGVMDARKLAMQIYDGYDRKQGAVRPLDNRAIAQLPIPLRDLLKSSFDAQNGFNELLYKVREYTAGIKSESLKAGYSELIDAWEKGKSEEILKKRMEVAYKEKIRFFARRIADTELTRKYQEENGIEFINDNNIAVVQVILSPIHNITDICDYHAEYDGWGLGEGCYPRDKAPLPPYHPFCHCVISSRPGLDYSGWGERNDLAGFLRTKGAGFGALIMGSRDKYERAIGGDGIDDILNEGKNTAYHLRRIGDLVKPK